MPEGTLEALRRIAELELRVASPRYLNGADDRGRLIPYFQIPPVRLGPLTIQPFGVLAAAGVYLASVLLVRRARDEGLDPAPLNSFAAWALIGGIIGGHFVHLFLYHPEELRPGGALQVLKVWDGLSSTGGVLGGLVAGAAFFRIRGLSFTAYGDVFALSVAPGWAVARLGCFSVHDHPGVLTSFPLAVAFPGGARHDLGFYDALLLAAITVILYALRRSVLRGALLGVLALLYGIGRFLLDFLRARDLPYVDARYVGLTPAQWFCLALIVYGLVRVTRAMRHPPEPSAARSS
ncbi:MAG TPA: prolipoprotein diacylglyceryl transferase family protein [Myxococcales bacterium]|nr:prolipoprotein diacylglyceryl transferase family protein [Myxococcales bacterium]